MITEKRQILASPGEQSLSLDANKARCDRRSLRVFLIKQKLTENAPGIRGMSAKNFGRPGGRSRLSRALPKRECEALHKAGRAEHDRERVAPTSMLSSSADPDLRRIAWQVEGADMGPGSQQEYRRYKGRWL